MPVFLSKKKKEKQNPIERKKYIKFATWAMREIKNEKKL